MTTGPASSAPSLEATLRSRRDGGRKLLVPYLTGGLGSRWLDVVRAAADAGADGVEIGIPFSDPVMDGPVIQRASEMALAGGATPTSILDELAGLDAGIPLAVMTYYNICFHAGHERFAASLAAAGVSGAILPDLPLEEVGPWAAAADAAGIETVMLAAPTAPDDRLPAICARSRGFVYAVGLLGVTGERAELAASATVIAKRLKDITDKPVLIGVGVSDAAQATEACTIADGVVIGSAVMRRVLDARDDDEGPAAAHAFLSDVRAALDAS